MATNRKRLLWVDDDGKGRFRYSRRILEREGWAVVWAEDINTACALLASEDFGALILDQSLPFVKEVTPTGIEGGYLILHWLRQGSLPEQFDLPQGTSPAQLKPPRRSNIHLPVLFESAYFDENLESQMQRVNGENHPVKIIPKPLDHHELRHFICEIQNNIEGEQE